jgi:hypothetical protein
MRAALALVIVAAILTPANAQNPERLARLTDLSAAKIHRYERLADRFGIPLAAIDSGLIDFNDHMARLGRGAPTEVAGWQHLGPEVFRFGVDIRELPRDAQLDATMRALLGISQLDQRRHLLRFFGLPEDFAAVTASDLAEKADEQPATLTSGSVAIGSWLLSQRMFFCPTDKCSGVGPRSYQILTTAHATGHPDAAFIVGCQEGIFDVAFRPFAAPFVPSVSELFITIDEVAATIRVPATSNGDLIEAKLDANGVGRIGGAIRTLSASLSATPGVVFPSERTRAALAALNVACNP